MCRQYRCKDLNRWVSSFNDPCRVSVKPNKAAITREREAILDHLSEMRSLQKHLWPLQIEAVLFIAFGAVLWWALSKLQLWLWSKSSKMQQAATAIKGNMPTSEANLGASGSLSLSSKPELLSPSSPCAYCGELPIS